MSEVTPTKFPCTFSREVEDCNVCREIAMGCAEDCLNTLSCAACNRRSYIDFGNGTAIACSSCARGYRLKLWLKHSGREDGPIRLAA